MDADIFGAIALILDEHREQLRLEDTIREIIPVILSEAKFNEIGKIEYTAIHFF